MRFLLILGLFVLSSFSTVSAVPIRVDITSTIAGPALAGTLRVDLIDGDGLNGSFAQLSDLSILPTSFDGAVTQPSPGTFKIADDLFISSLSVDMSNVYNGLGFMLDLQLQQSGNAGFPDSLVFTFLDTAGNTLFNTEDPRGTNAALIFSANTRELYAPEGFNIVFDGRNDVPEPATLLLVAIGLAGIACMRKKRMVFLNTALLLGIGSANAALNDVTPAVTIIKGPLAFNRANNTYDTLITVQNNGISLLNSPMYVVVTGLPETVSVNNATNISPDGKPMLLLPSEELGLSPGSAVTNFAIRFHNPSRVKFTPTLRVLSYTGTELPPDPGETGTTTLAGIDANNNGIRDDVEIYIATNFGHSARLVQALNDYAVASQRGILSTNSQESLLAGNLLSRAMECLKYVAPAEEDSRKSVQAISLNTAPRLSAWLQHQGRLSGTVLRSRPISEWASSCTFPAPPIRN